MGAGHGILNINDAVARIESPSGPLLVSRIGDAGCTESGPMVPKQLLQDPMKGVGSSRQQECGHGS